MKSTTVRLGLWLFFSLFTVSPLAAQINSECRTPHRRAGVCIPLNQCAELYAIQQGPRPIPDASLTLLTGSQCGYDRQIRQPLVCCRLNNPPTTKTTPSTQIPTIPITARTITRIGPSDSDSSIEEPVLPPKDVSGHRNVGLINSDLCGQSTSGRIIGGELTGLFEFPWMTLLKYRSTKRGQTEESFKCGGTLINNRYILTAAHCISDKARLRLISVRLGEHNTETEVDCEESFGERFCAPPYQDINVQGFFRHPDYNARTYANDIALIRLAQPANTTVETVRPICLPVGLDEQTKNLDGTKLWVVGWGFTETSVASTEMLKVSVPVMPVQQCHDVFRRFNFNINGNQLCAGGTDERKDSCRGDSGGPLKKFAWVNSQSSTVQYGVVSYGHRNCGTAGIPGVYTRVGHYMDWILNTIRP